MTIKVGESLGVVAHHGVQIQRLRIGEIGIGDRNRRGGPVRAEPTAKARGIKARSKIIVSGFRVAFLAGEVQRTGVRAGAGEPVAERHTHATPDDVGGDASAHSLRPQVVGVNEISRAVLVGGHMLAPGVNFAAINRPVVPKFLYPGFLG